MTIRMYDNFVLATLRDYVQDLQKLRGQAASRLWREAREVIDTAARLREEELTLHRRYYKDRVEQQEDVVRDDDKPPHRKFEPWGFGGAQFDEDRVTRVAKARVDQGHTMRMAEITRNEIEGLRAIKRESRSIGRLWGRARKDFNKEAEPTRSRSLRMRFHRHRG